MEAPAREAGDAPAHAGGRRKRGKRAGRPRPSGVPEREAAAAVAGNDVATTPASEPAGPRAGAGGPRRRLAWPPWAGLPLVLVAAAWLYAPALDTPFFADDYLFLDQVRGRSLGAVLASPDPLSNFYRPVGRQFYFWLVANAGGGSPVVFHAVGLALFLAIVALLYGVTRRLAGGAAATIAAAFLALHYAADVPVRWASGAQELLAVAFGLAAVWLHLAGRRLPAAAALLVGALAKETALVVPVIAVVAGRAPGEPWRDAARRAWPLGVALVAWVLIWSSAPERHAQMAQDLTFDPTAPLAALAHLVQVTVGLEWRQGEMGLPRTWPPLAPLALVLAAVALRMGRSGRVGVSDSPRPAVAAGIAWAVAAAAPVAAAGHAWSAYYYLFAMCGVGLALGAWLAARPRPVALAAVAVLATGSASARSLDEFAVVRSAWTGRSHLNGFYIERATRHVAGYLEALKAARPSFPPNSTVFFTGLKGNVAFQTSDGPLLRWAYRDTSLRSYYLQSFSRDKTRRGPVFFFVASGDTLEEMAPGDDLFQRLAFGSLLSERPEVAREALLLGLDENPANATASYWLAWTQLARGDTAAVLASLELAGVTPDPHPSPGIARAMEAVAAGDTLGALRIMRAAVAAHGLDPGAHALLADLALVVDRDDAQGAIEAYATRLLVPWQPYAWRRWAMVQAQHGRYLESLASFERYFALAGAAGEADGEARAWVAQLRRMVPGGDLAAGNLRE